MNVIFTLFAKAGAMPLNRFIFFFFLPMLRRCSKYVIHSWDSEYIIFMRFAVIIFNFLIPFVDVVHFVQIWQSWIIRQVIWFTWMIFLFFFKAPEGGEGELFSYYFARFRSRSYEDLSFSLLIWNKADAKSPVRPELAPCGGHLGMGMESKAWILSGFSILSKVF